MHHTKVAWTGGNTPSREFCRTNKEFRSMRKQFFRDTVAICGGLDLWECAGTSSLERARIFWNQATLDAWRTFTVIHGSR